MGLPEFGLTVMLGALGVLGLLWLGLCGFAWIVGKTLDAADRAWYP